MLKDLLYLLTTKSRYVTIIAVFHNACIRYSISRVLIVGLFPLKLFYNDTGMFFLIYVLQ